MNRTFSRAAVAVGASAMLVPPVARSQSNTDGASAEILVGTAWSLPLPLTLSGPQSVRIHARYSTRPFRDAPYYAARIGHSEDGRGYEVELIHHKTYLENPAPPIEHLEISHGYNLLMANALRPAGGWQVRVGLGLVIAHPDGTIAGQDIKAKQRTLLGGGYHIAGGSLQVAFGRRYALTTGNPILTVAPEVKLTGSFARMRLAQGTLSVPNLAFHALAGLGIQER